MSVPPFVVSWRDSSGFGSSAVPEVLGRILQQGERKRELPLVQAEQGKAEACSVN